MLRKVVLGHDAVNYIRLYLSEGGTLSHLLSSLPLDSGRITTFVPRTLSDAGIRSFATGWRPNPGGVSDRVRTLIASYLRAQPGRGAVFEDINGVLPQQGTGPPGYPYFVFDGEIYPFLTSAQGGTKAVRRVMLETYSYRFLAVLGDFAETLAAHAGHIVSEDFLQNTASRAEQIVVGAYDSDGCLIWVRG